MKYLFTLVFALLAGVATTKAQTVTIVKADGTTVKYQASEVKSIQFANEEQQPGINKSFTGYLLVNSKFFGDTYYGDKAKMDVFTKDGKTYCKFTDEKWGEGTFEITLNRGNISGQGKMKVPDAHNPGKFTEHNATMSGPMTAINITINGLMGTTTIKWKNGAAPKATTLLGSYPGKNSFNLGAFGTFNNINTTVSLMMDENGKYNIKVSSQQILGTIMGDLTVGEYTIKDLTFDEATNTFSKDYSKDGVKMHLKAVNGGKETMNGDYEHHNATIKAVFGTDGSLTVENNYQAGRMPFPLKGTFTGKIQK